MNRKIDQAAAVEAAKTVRVAVDSLLERRGVLKAERDTLKSGINELLDRPVPNDAAKAFIFDLIDQGAADFMERSRWPEVFEHIAFPLSKGEEHKYLPGSTTKPPPLSIRAIDRLLVGNADSAASHLRKANLGFFMGPPETNGLAIGSPFRFYFFFGDLIKAKIDQYFDQFYPEYRRGQPNPTDSVDERRASIDSMRTRVEEIDSELGTITSNLLALGYDK